MTDIRPIRNDADRDSAMRRIEELWDAPDGSKEGDELEVLAIMVEDYEESQMPGPARMSVREKLAYHLEMVIWEDAGEGVSMNAREVGALVSEASDAQKLRAYDRALTRSPMLLPDELDEARHLACGGPAVRALI